MTATDKCILVSAFLRDILNFNISFLTFREYDFGVLFDILIFKEELC